VYRFRHDQRPLHEAEGAFTLFGFATALATAQQGRHTQAAGWLAPESPATLPFTMLMLILSSIGSDRTGIKWARWNPSAS
jgi:hypothetical protein